MSPQKPRGPSASGASTPLSTLKRRGGAADLRDRSGGHKRQASTAFSFDDSQPLDLAGAEFDVLDLTGPDVDEDATFVARQIMANYQRKQKQREVLASQPPAPAPLPGQPAAPSSATQPHPPEALSSANAETLFVRGSLDVDNVLGARSPARPGNSNLPPNLPGPFSLVPRQPPPAGPQHPAHPPMQLVRQVGMPMLNRHPLIIGPSPALPQAPQMPPTGLRTGPFVPQPPRVQGGALAEVIGRTALFDYMTGVDEFGNPLPDRLLDYLEDDAFGATPAISEKELDDLLNNIRPDLELANKDLNNTPQGLRMPLYRHQSVALDWMTSMEKGTNKGGILADDMGLGKTISTIALMLSRKATSRPKTNLIITPLSLIRQWEEEITKKTRSSHRLSILVYHSKKVDINEMLKYDVVLTTYGTMAAEFKRLEQFQENNKGRIVDFSDSSLRYKFPLLHPGRAKFHRVILDEAQCIKNKKTKTALACQSLTALHRWCLTGTPMMNGVVELFSLLKFLRIKPYNNWTHFRDAFKPLIDKGGHHKHAAMDKLRALLKAVMMRRKKDSEIDGKPILQLPEKTEELVYIDLSNDERDFYAQLELKSQVQFSKYLRDNSIGENYSKVLVLLLRLRQACCHPHLNLDVKDSIASLLSDEEMMAIVSRLEPAIVSRIKELKIFECPICYDFVGCPYFFGQCGHLSCSQCFIRLVDGARAENLQEGEESDTAKCPVCRASFDMKKIFTYDIFQKKYLPESVETREEDEEATDDYKYDWTDNESESDDDTDSEIDENGNLKDFIDDADADPDFQDDGVDDDRKKEDAVYEGESRRKMKTSKKDKNGKGKARIVNIRPSMLKTLRKDASRSQEAYRKYMAYLKQTWLPSAKVSKCIELVQKAAEDGEKIIVFSQWTLLLDLIQVGLKHEKFRSELRRYDGSMSSEQRFEAVREFRDNKKVIAMLVSLRAGNAGLNLTAASRVIIMDPFWNPYVERQAVDRAYRIGQHKKVTVYRILTKETIEDRIIALQEKKQEMVEAALDEAEGVKISRLDVRQLKFLFNTAK